DILRKFGKLRRLAHSTRERSQKSPQVTGVSSVTHGGNVGFHYLVQIAIEPVASVFLFPVDDFGPPADDDSPEQFIEAKMRSQPGLLRAFEQSGERDLAIRVAGLEQAHGAHLEYGEPSRTGVSSCIVAGSGRTGEDEIALGVAVIHASTYEVPNTGFHLPLIEDDGWRAGE